MSAIDGFAFYNSNKVAGSSQLHKHFQSIPYSSFPPHILLFEEIESKSVNNTFPYFNFMHKVKLFDKEISQCKYSEASIGAYAKNAKNIFDQTMKELGNPKCYNMLLTNKLMLIVCRSQEKYKNISINGISFAGTLLILKKFEEDVYGVDPLEILKAVCTPLSK